MKFEVMLAAAFALSAQGAHAQSLGSKPFLSMQGHAEMLVKPDIFPIKVTLNETGMDPAKSQGLVEDLAERVLASAAVLKVPDVDIEVGNLSVSPETKWDDEEEKEIFLGNTYEREFTIRFRSLDKLREFIEKMPDSRQLRLATQKFEHSRADELKRELRRLAIEDAKRGAADMAAAVGKRLTDLHNVSDRAQSTGYSSSGYSTLDAVAVSGTSVRPRQIVLREGEIKLSADAFLVYLIGD